MSFMQEMAAIQENCALKVAQIQAWFWLDAATCASRIAAVRAERDAAITLLATRTDDRPATIPSVGSPCVKCAAAGVRSLANRCAARPVGVACGADTFRCHGCPTSGGSRRPCRLCVAA